MSANLKPIFPLIPVCNVATITAANTLRTGGGTIVDLVTGDADGTRIDQIIVQALVTTTAGMVRFFVHDGSAYHLCYEQLVPATTASGSAVAFRAEILRNDGRGWMILPSGHKIGVATDKAEEFRVIALGGDYS